MLEKSIRNIAGTIHLKQTHIFPTGKSISYEYETIKVVNDSQQ